MSWALQVQFPDETSRDTYLKEATAALPHSTVTPVNFPFQPPSVRVASPTKSPLAALLTHTADRYDITGLALMQDRPVEPEEG